MALMVSNVSFVFHEVDLRHKPAALLAVSPKATVPGLLPANGQVIDESLDIMRWALRQNDPEDWLAGDNASLIEIFYITFKQRLNRYQYAERESTKSIDNFSTSVM
jgi:glutathione S-transferase